MTTAPCAGAELVWIVAGARACPVCAALFSFGQSIGGVAFFARYGLWRPGLVLIPHVVALGIMASTETTVTAAAAFLLAGGQKPPHIILVHDESSFDIRRAPGIKLPQGYDRHFHSFDGKERSFIVEGAGGPTWFAEYSVLTGLSARSFGRFAYLSPASPPAALSADCRTCCNAAVIVPSPSIRRAALS